MPWYNPFKSKKNKKTEGGGEGKKAEAAAAAAEEEDAKAALANADNGRYLVEIEAKEYDGNINVRDVNEIVEIDIDGQEEEEEDDEEEDFAPVKSITPPLPLMALRTNCALCPMVYTVEKIRRTWRRQYGAWC